MSSSTVKISRPPGRSAPADAVNNPLEGAKVDEGVRRHDRVECARGVAQIRGQFTLEQFVVDVLGLRLRQHARGQVDSHQPTCVRRDERPAQPGAASSVQHIEPLRRIGVGSGQHRRDQGRGAVRQLRRAWRRSCPRSCRRSSSMKASDARAGTSRPEHAAIMCRAMGLSGSSASHSSNTRTASSTSPRVQCASASSLRASGCFGLKVMTLQKQTAASCVRF